MNCQDSAKLRTPLDTICQTTDIGCVPIVSGKPDCNPQPDQLPFAFDPSTTTLWLFSCESREWISFTKFSMCQLNALNLDNIRNICDVIQVGVNYVGSGECEQGTITLGEFAERILECLKLETKIITIGEGEGNKLKISIEGLPLDPVYVQGKNIWSEGGSGTEADPLIVATHDPICKWSAKTQEEVESAEVVHIGACLDGNMVRIPLPKDMYKEYVPTPEYLCIPFVAEAPVNPPAYGTGPVRAGCNGRFWFWLCNEEKWVEYSTGKDYEGWDTQRKIIANHCENVKFHGWSKQGECEIDFEISPVDLWELLDNCAGICSSQYLTEEEVNDILGDDPGRVRNVICVDGNTTVTDMSCCPVVKRLFSDVSSGVCIGVSVDSLPIAYEYRTNRIVYGSATIVEGSGGIMRISATNTFPNKALLSVTGRNSTSVFADDKKGSSILWITENPETSFEEAIEAGETPQSVTRTVDNFPNQVAFPSDIPHYVVEGSSATFNKILDPGETVNLYFHVWMICNSLGNYMFHSYVLANGYLFNNVVE